MSKDTALEAAAVAGWNACRKSIYAVCEDMAERQYNPARAVPLRGLATPTQEAHSRGFYAGGKDAAKSLARGFNSMEAQDDNHFRDAVTALGAATPSETFGAALTALPALALAADCYVAIKVYASKADCEKAEGRS